MYTARNSRETIPATTTISVCGYMNSHSGCRNIVMTGTVAADLGKYHNGIINLPPSVDRNLHRTPAQNSSSDATLFPIANLQTEYTGRIWLKIFTASAGI